MINNNKFIIWGRTFSLPVKYMQYTGQGILPEQNIALELFLKNVCFSDTVKKKVESFCYEQNKQEVQTENTDNIFRYIMPQYLFIPRNEERTVAVMCSYKFNMEQGIAIVFKNETLFEVGFQDIIL